MMTIRSIELFLGERRRRADAAWGQTVTRADELVREKRGSAGRVRRDEKSSAEYAAALERQRIKAILTSEAGRRSPRLARRLAFEGDLSSADAIFLLEAAPDRQVVAETTAKDIIAAAELARSGQVQPTMPAKGSLAGAIIAAGRKARGERA